MFEPKQILVPTDFSTPAWAALEDAAEIAETYGAWLDIIHVWDISEFAVPGDMAGYGLPNTVIDTVSDQAHRMCDGVRTPQQPKPVCCC